MRMGRKFACTVVAAAAAMTWTGIPIGGGQTPAAAADCTFTYPLLLHPGIGKKPSSGPLHTEGKSGRFNCQGYQGDTGFDGTYGTAGPVTCASGGEGAGKLSWRIGFQDYQEDIRFSFGAIKGGKVSGTFEGGSYAGTYTFTATKGTCAGAITEGTLTGEFSRK